MKNQKIIVLAVVFVAFSQCKKASEEPYPSENIIMDNAQATMYFHTVFREAENAWAFIHEKEYEEATFSDLVSTSTSYKEMTYEPYKNIKNKNMITIVYHEWKSNDLLLMGKIIVVFDNDSCYRKDNKTANITLTDFTINGQNVAGEATMRYRKVGSNPNDQYAYSLLNGATIYEKKNSKKALISCTIGNGQYERIEGNDTLSQDDDVWAYSGTMTGTLRDDPKLKYTNTVTPSMTQNNQTFDTRINFKIGCKTAFGKTAYDGFSQIKISKYPDIIYWYLCNEIYFRSTKLYIR